MTETNMKMPVKIEKTSPATPQPWRSFESLRRQVDRLFDDTPVASGARRSIAHSLISSPFGEPNRQWHRLLTSTETNKAYEITTELLGMDEKNVEVR